MHKCFISYKKEDVAYRNYIIDNFGGDNFVNKSLDRTIDSYDGDYVMKVIRQDYLCDSTVTLFLIGTHSSENEGSDWLGDRNYFIKRELAASLFNGSGNTRNGILGIVLPSMYDRVYCGESKCATCGNTHNLVNINDSTAIREFSCNYYTQPHDGCSWSEGERYCVLVKWDDFTENPEKYINQAFDKRNSAVASKIRIRNLR
jgi:hypothetical protein